MKGSGYGAHRKDEAKSGSRQSNVPRRAQPPTR